MNFSTQSPQLPSELDKEWEKPNQANAAARNRGADYVEYLVPSLRAGTRYSTCHREPHNQTAFACTAPGAGQHRDYALERRGYEYT